jgi:hypothetical protein
MWVEGAQRYDINAETNFGGTFKGRAFIPGIGVTYCFEKPGPIKGDGAIDL